MLPDSERLSSLILTQKYPTEHFHSLRGPSLDIDVSELHIIIITLILRWFFVCFHF